MTTTKPRGKPFRPGISGNPKGRPASASTVAKLRASIAKDIPEIIAKQVELAKAGDAQAARLLIERVLPPIRATEQAAPMNLPTGSLADQGRAILASTAAGELTPGQGAQLLTGLGAVAKLIETDELAVRVAALEKKNAES